MTSDTLFNRAQTIELADHPFNSVEEMDAELTRRWNETVAPDDIVLHLGDLALGPIAESLQLTAQLRAPLPFLATTTASPATQTNCVIERFTPLDKAAGWSVVPEVVSGMRAEIKSRFRSGELEVLIGTDSMSEGLNLQTSGRLINYDMPWNLMRVEQRIGRVDRIGASYKDIRISNYFYADTVEEQVYKGIAEDYGDFTDIVGDAAPVLANIEKAIERLALTGHATTTEIDSEVGQIRQQVEDIKGEPLNNDDIGEPADGGRIKEPPTLVGDATPRDLEQVLKTNGLTRGAIAPDRTRPGVYGLKLPAENLSAVSFSKAGGVHDIEEYFDPSPVAPLPVTFDRATWDESDDPALVFLTYGTPELAALLPATDSDA